MRTENQQPDLSKYGDRPVTPEEMHEEEEKNRKIAEAYRVNEDPEQKQD